MKVDIEELKAKVEENYANRAHDADKIKDDRIAMSALTHLETQQQKEMAVIDSFCALVQKYS